MDMKKILQVLSESTMASAEKHEQGPEFTGYWKGTDKATPGKKMVGGESIIPSLAKQAKDNTVKNRLVKEFEQFKEAQEEFVLYIDGKPASKYNDHKDAHRDLEFIRKKYPNKQSELKQEVCNLKTLPEGKLPDEYTLNQPKEQSLNDVLFQTAANAMVNANREGSFIDTEDAIKQASQITKIPYVPSQLPALYSQLQKIEQQLATQKQVRKNQLSREKEKLTHQTTPDEERRAQEFMKQRDKQMKDRLSLRSEELELDEFAPPVNELDEDSELHFKNSNPKDVVKVDVPLLIRLLEYAREDAKTDMDLHNVAERLIAMSADGSVLSMDEYDAIVGQTQEDLINELGADNPQMAQQGSTATPAGKNPDDAEELAQTQKAIQNLKPALQAAGAQNIDPGKLSQTLVKVGNSPQAKPMGQDQTQIDKLAPLTAKIATDPQAVQQLKQLAQRAVQK